MLSLHVYQRFNKSSLQQYFCTGIVSNAIFKSNNITNGQQEAVQLAE